MPKIHLLPDALISQIAAGEVVERPASVIKELLENSIDAGATHCIVEVEQGGMKLIAVRDDGHGMSAEDASMAFARHATSKISSLEDLVEVRTFGFRGEALAAISSVAQVTLKTREENSEAGSRVVCNGGVLEKLTAIGCPVGTSIVAQNLFYNTPARKKFVKSESTELQHCMATVSHAALSHPRVGFEFKNNGRTLLQVAAGSSRQERLAAIVGGDFARTAVAVHFETPSISISGYIGKPGTHMGSKRHQYLFVNGRDVTDVMISCAVMDAYGTLLPGRAYPMFLLHVDIPAHDVDVNVHPRKLAVKFSEPQRVYRDVAQAVKQALTTSTLFAKENVAEFSPAFVPTFRPQSSIELESFSSPAAAAVPQQDHRPAGLSHHTTILGYMANSYILIFDEEGLAIVDQHAAHERIMYEALCAQRTSQTPAMQPLLVPLSLECSREQAIFFEDAQPFLTSLGFEVEAWSGSTFLIRSIPASFKSENIENVVKGLLEDMVRGAEAGKSTPERILKSLACKAAVKFGMPLTFSEQQKLIGELSTTPNNGTCPHGRPTKVLVSFEELERRFLR